MARPSTTSKTQTPARITFRIAALKNHKSSVEPELRREPNKKYHIEFFATPAADPSGHGEGKLFLESTVVRTDKYGEKEVDVKLNTLPVVAPVDVITVTATALLSTHPKANTTPVLNTIGARVTRTKMDVLAKRRPP